MTKVKTLQKKSVKQRYLTQKEVCRLLSISRTTLWRMISRGEIVAVRLGTLRKSLVRIHETEVQKLIGETPHVSFE